jgi:hypothetical protein
MKSTNLIWIVAAAALAVDLTFALLKKFGVALPGLTA